MALSPKGLGHVWILISAKVGILRLSKLPIVNIGLKSN